MQADPYPGRTGSRAMIVRLLGGSLLTVVALGAPTSVAAQDVEMLGRMYGTTPPPAYFERGPDAFRFERGMRPPVVGASGGQLPPGSALRGARAILGARGAPVVGQFNVPVIMALFQGAPVPFGLDAPTVQAHYFDGPNPTGTITEYYRTASQNRVELRGLVSGWFSTTLTESQVAGGESALGPASRIGEFVVQAAARADSTGIDWGVFDNDGPDGTPNSGDDDGFVDVFAVLHPGIGAECGSGPNSDQVWSHRWTVEAQVGGPYRTSTPSASGGFIKVNDYVVQPMRSCGGGEINPIGVFAHELGHGFGLPDLYAVGGAHAGVGQWDLMGTGSWGCPGTFDPARPCGMGAWTRSVLGWTEIQDVGADTDLGLTRLRPSAGLGPVLRIASRDPDEYYLVENRGALAGSTSASLMVWWVHARDLATAWERNEVNSDPEAQAVRVVQADGHNHLGRPGGGRGDIGDLFPGSTNLRDFHAGTVPASESRAGAVAGVTLTGIRAAGPDVIVHVSTEMHELLVQAVGLPDSATWLRVNGAPPRAAMIRIPAAPFQSHHLEAEPGAAVAPGVRIGFQGWADGSPRVRTVITGRADTTIAALFSGRQVQLDVDLTSPVSGVTPGRLDTDPSSPDLWFSQGATVRVEAVATRGFAFQDWAGTQAGGTNPLQLRMDQPLHLEARFSVTFALSVPDRLTWEGGTDVAEDFQTQAASAPVVWSVDSGSLPDGVLLRGSGRLEGVPLQAGRFAVVIKATDARGLTATQPMDIEVIAPAVSTQELARSLMDPSAALTSGQAAFFDHAGNGNGVFDLGDLRIRLLGGAP